MRFNSINILILFLGCVMLFQITFLFFSINTYVEKKDCLVPAWHFSKSKEKWIFGGFTADLGWILMVSRYAYSTSREVSFPKTWGHGDFNTTNWESMFEEPYKSCVHKTFFENKNTRLRQKVKFKSFYNAGGGLNPNENAQKYLGFYLIEKNNDLKTMRSIFKKNFKLNESARKEVDKFKIDIQQPYVSIHVRWGDKIGRGHPQDPKESVFVPLKYYVSQIPSHIKNVYVGTDDANAILKLKELLPSHNLFYQNDLKVGGFSITLYEPNITKTFQLWADIELMSEAQLFIGNFESSVSRITHLMRNQESIDVIDVFKKRKRWQCCENKYNNCFWFCKN